MVASSVASAIAVEAQPPLADLTETPATTASIAAYLNSGERARSLSDVALKVSMVALVLIALAWALRVLPGAVALF
jgi:hypothetical protein